MPLEASCHCGHSVLSVPEPPATITDCNCSLCFKYGVMWAYYPIDLVDRSRLGTTEAYVGRTKTRGFHRCASCGCVVCWWPTDPSVRKVGVNARLFPLDLATRLRVRHLDGAHTEEYID